jgi:low affinity Fe/Cu permease
MPLTTKEDFLWSVHSMNTGSLENLAYHSARWAGSPWAYLAAVGFTLAWLVSGPFLQFSDPWELIMKTASGAVTFLMVFLIQRSQNKDSLAMQIKLNEIIAALHGANNRMISIEDLSEGEIHSLQKDYQTLATHINRDNGASTRAVSMEEVVKLEEDVIIPEGKALTVT